MKLTKLLGLFYLGLLVYTLLPFGVQVFFAWVYGGYIHEGDKKIPCLFDWMKGKGVCVGR